MPNRSSDLCRVKALDRVLVVLPCLKITPFCRYFTRFTVMIRLPPRPFRPACSTPSDLRAVRHEVPVAIVVETPQYQVGILEYHLELRFIVVGLRRMSTPKTGLAAHSSLQWN